jgi:hypothetical protein
MSAYKHADRPCRGWPRAAWAQQSSRPHKTWGIAPFTALAVVLLVALSPILASQGALSQVAGRAGPLKAAAAPQGVSTSGYTVPSNLSYCGLLGPNPGSAPGLPGYDANVTLLWNELCVQQVFSSWIDAWGGPFYLAYPDSGANLSYWAAQNFSAGSSGSPQGLYADFNILYQPGWCSNTSAYHVTTRPCSWEEFWLGDVWTNVLSGPFFLNSSCGCGSKGPPPPVSPGFPYGPVLGFGLAGVVAIGVVFSVRRRS